MSGFGYLKINQTRDLTNHSKVLIRTGDQDLLNSLLLKIAGMSVNEFAKIIYSFGHKDNELRIFSQLGRAMDVLSHLLEGYDYNRVSTEATIDIIN